QPASHPRRRTPYRRCRTLSLDSTGPGNDIRIPPLHLARVEESFLLVLHLVPHEKALGCISRHPLDHRRTLRGTTDKMFPDHPSSTRSRFVQALPLGSRVIVIRLMSSTTLCLACQLKPQKCYRLGV